MSLSRPAATDKRRRSPRSARRAGAPRAKLTAIAPADPDSDAFLPWAISGTYLEACNCEAICPCRRIDGRSGGRSTFGECMGALSWQVDRGHAGEIDLRGQRAVLATRYDDDEAGSPWSIVVYVDERGDRDQRDALTRILLGRLGGTPLRQFPWAWKASDLLGVRDVAIEIDHAPGRGWFRAGDEVTLRIREPVADRAQVTCVIPGHDRPGRELVAETLAVDGELEFAFTGRCAYESTFDYSSGDE